ncbi:STAS/SEC14 domain-containing protein [Nocardia sp. NPDC051321]|uniref:STAS/SEC14 domain-containing protein n=1 Tax=Nocardia sp. NPDC051321 TaxID=3364323 RepID=UPI0037BACC2C
MLEQLTDVPSGVQGLRAIGTVSKRDYDNAFAPLVEDAWQAGDRMRLLYEFGPQFDRLTPAALVADAGLGARYLRLLDGCAVVSDRAWLRDSTSRIGAQMPCPVRVFTVAQHDEALAWLASLPARTVPSHRDIAAAYLGGTVAAICWFVSACTARLHRSPRFKGPR